ncbi:MAG: DUF3089 domain-containing protein [Caulobacteraceae bacterium]|nr:DUF3089 domain-containing protein [Caulobacter sp.]
MPVGWRWRWLALATLLAGVVCAGAAWWWRDAILQTALDPRVPFQTYTPPPAPDYARREAWAALPQDPTHPAAGTPGADVFFVHPTTYDGGRDWNGPIADRRARRELDEVMLPNYAQPFARVGRVWAPRYRQASLYSLLTLREDARDARRFAYGDVRRAFEAFLRTTPLGRPLLIVGVEQGALLADRLAAEAAADPAVRRRLAAVYLIGAPIPAAAHGPGAPLPACSARAQAGCVVAYTQAAFALDGPDHVLDRALVWTPQGDLTPLEGRPALCVNPLTGAVGAPVASEHADLGAANATRLEWSARPAFLAHQVSARCEGGLLRTSRPRAHSLRRTGGWAARLKAPPFNLFWADLEADAAARLAAWRRRDVSR